MEHRKRIEQVLHHEEHSSFVTIGGVTGEGCACLILGGSDNIIIPLDSYLVRSTTGSVPQ